MNVWNQHNHWLNKLLMLNTKHIQEENNNFFPFRISNGEKEL